MHWSGVLGSNDITASVAGAYMGCPAAGSYLNHWRRTVSTTALQVKLGPQTHQHGPAGTRQALRLLAKRPVV